MKRLFLLTSFLLSGIVTMPTFAQEDAKAKTILNELSKKTKAYKTIKADFVFTIEKKGSKEKETQNGTIQLKGDKYKLNIKGQDVISDGKTTWTYLKDANEVQINNVDPNNAESISPTNIFTMYEKGFKYKFEKEETKAGKVTQIINLYPTNPDKKKFHTVKLYVDKAKKQITSVKVMMKDGNVYTYTIKTFSPNLDLKDVLFVFDKKAYPGVETVDLRE